MAVVSSSGRSGGTFRISVHLLDIAPMIWRSVNVPADLTLRELHAVLQGAMGWQDSHLHSFEIGDRQYEVPESESVGPAKGYEDERDVLLLEVMKRGTRAQYLYDFGDRWWHAIEIEHWDKETIEWPQCIDGKRACPPEDCGSTEGYARLLKELSNKRHRNHAEAVAWAPGFKPGVFSISQANNLILTMAVLYGERGWGFPEFGRAHG